MKIIVISSHTNSLLWFRMDMMKNFIQKGYDVTAIGPKTEQSTINKFIENQVSYKEITILRNGLNPFNDIKTLLQIYRILKFEKPDKVFAYQAKSIIYGSIASRINGISEIYLLIAGLGSIFRGNGFKNLVLKKILSFQYRLACSFAKKIIVQNKDDLEELILNNIARNEKFEIVNGSGVNLEIFSVKPLPDETCFLYIGRLIRDKGVLEYLEACKQVKMTNPKIRCILVGPFDTNPSSLKEKDLKPYIDQNIIEYFGEQQDVRPYIEMCNIFVLPSYHEGTPKTVLESMAMGRAIITSDAPGCRETVIDGYNGYLVPVKDVASLSEKMMFCSNNKDIVEKFGRNSYLIAKEKYDINIINKRMLEIMNLD
ncbi:MAG: glycosyltransferase family 4 protein [Erysipelotrichaceae bacterium]